MRRWTDEESDIIWNHVWFRSMRLAPHPPMLGRADGHVETDPFSELTGGQRPEATAAWEFQRWFNVEYKRERLPVT